MTAKGSTPPEATDLLHPEFIAYQFDMGNPDAPVYVQRLGQPSIEKARAMVKNKRGKITTYSSDSKHRLTLQGFRLTRAFLDAHSRWALLFVTLTLPGKDWESIDYKRAFKLFRDRLRAEYPDAYGYWVAEIQKRGAVHFHLVLLDAFPGRPGVVHTGTGAMGWWADHDALKAFRVWLAKTWFRSCGSGQADHLKAGTQADFVEEPRSAYLAKESGKRLQKSWPPDPDMHGPPPRPVYVGQWWGHINRPKVRANEQEFKTWLTPGQAAQIDEALGVYWQPIQERAAQARGGGHFRTPSYFPAEAAFLKALGRREKVHRHD